MAQVFVTFSTARGEGTGGRREGGGGGGPLESYVCAPICQQSFSVLSAGGCSSSSPMLDLFNFFDFFAGGCSSLNFFDFFSGGCSSP